MFNVILLGPPGSGKGTQASMLVDKFNLTKIATGDILRRISTQEDSLSQQLKQVLAKGDYISDDIINNLVFKELQASKNIDGFVFDGYPRTLAQAKALIDCLSSVNQKITQVINLEISEDKLLERLQSRKYCGKCKESYHDKFRPEKVNNVCDKCGNSPLLRREDDNIDTIKHRFKLYNMQTKELIDFFEQFCPVLKIDASLPILQVSSVIEKIMR